jgi:predicted lipoprotein with Yx(FWY)xxD motif
MSMLHGRSGLILAVPLVLLVAACSSSGASQSPAAAGGESAAPSTAAGGGYGASASPAESAEPSAAGGEYEVKAATTPAGLALTGENGMTLYTFTKDSANASVCEADCATNWPPFVLDAGETPTAGDGVTGALTTFARADGTLQVAYNGKPVYYFAADKAAGDSNGQGVGGFWFIAAP